jgi:hypothetical protein
MQILQIILIVTPGIIATHIYKFRRKCSFTFVEWLYHTAKYIFIIFWLMNVLQYVRGWGDFDWTRFSVQFILKYIPLVLALAMILPHINLLLNPPLDK